MKQKNNLRGLGNAESIGKANRIGQTEKIGKFKNDTLSFRKVTGRREFMDSVLDYIKKNENVSYSKLGAYFQYTTGASEATVKQSLAVLENVGLIESEERFEQGSIEYFFRGAVE